MTIEQIASFEGHLAKVEGGVRSGKTEALVQRAACLLKRGVAPEKILVETTSALGAQAFKKRLAAAMPDDEALASRVRICTALDACTDVLSTDAARAATGRTPRILANVEYNFVLEDVKTIGLARRRISMALRHAFQQWAKLEPEDGWLLDGEEAQLLTHLRSVLMMNECMLAEEVAPLAVSYLASDAGEPARKTFDYVLADDFQNLSRAEQTCLCLLAREQVIVAGNAAELAPVNTCSPYPAGFTKFNTNREGVEVFTLEHAFGASRPVEMADALLDQPGMEQGIATASFDDERGQVQYVKWPTPEAEINGMTKEFLLSMEAQGVNPEECLVLVPNLQWARTVEKVLRQRGFKTSLAGVGQRLAGDPRNSAKASALTAHIKLQLAGNPESPIAWRAWCGLDNGIGNSDIFDALMNHAIDANAGLYETLKKVCTGTDDMGILRADVLRQHWESGQKVIEELSNKKGFALLRAAGCEGLSSFSELSNIMAGDETPAELAALELSLVRQPVFPELPHTLRIATYRNMAGLSARWIYVLNCVDGLMPQRDAFEVVSTDKAREKLMEEERRLFAASIAKATERLSLSYFSACRLEIAEPAKVQVTRIRYEHGRRMALSRPCCFIAETGAACPGSISGQALLAPYAVDQND